MVVEREQAQDHNKEPGGCQFSPKGRRGAAPEFDEQKQRQTDENRETGYLRDDVGNNFFLGLQQGHEYAQKIGKASDQESQCKIRPEVNFLSRDQPGKQFGTEEQQKSDDGDIQEDHKDPNTQQK